MTLYQRLLQLNFHYSDKQNRGPGWDKRFSDDLMRTVLNHHEIPYATGELHQTFLTVAPYLFNEELDRK
jgi:hypothetical protein